MDAQPCRPAVQADTLLPPSGIRSHHIDAEAPSQRWLLRIMWGGAVLAVASIALVLAHSMLSAAKGSTLLITPVGLSAASCLGGWPSFHSAAHLSAHPAWASYITKVYGSVPSDASAYPWCMGDMWMFDTGAVLAAGISDFPQSIGMCPTSVGATEGQQYKQNSRIQPLNVTWSWHPSPYSAFAPESWIEVLHQGGFEDEDVGAWFLYAKGSGVWFNVGNTISFGDHEEAYEHFGVMGVERSSRNQAMSANASLAGYDSIQFLQHTCSMMYGDCLNRSSGFLYFNIEIVSTKLTGSYACTSSTGRSPLIRAGWRAALPCTCDNTKDYLNCGEVSISGAWKQQHAFKMPKAQGGGGMQGNDNTAMGSM